MTAQPRRLPICGEVIEPKHSKSVVRSLCRVLYVNEISNRIILIPIEPCRSKGRLYFVGMRDQELSLIMADLDKHISHILAKGVTPRPDVAATDADLDKKYLRQGQTISNIRSERNARYDIIKPLVENRDERELLFDAQIRLERIAARAKEIHTDNRTLGRTIKCITEILNQFFAEGATKGAVTPFSAAKGGRGKERDQINKLGKKNTPTKNRIEGVEGMVNPAFDRDLAQKAARCPSTPCSDRRLWVA